MDRVSTGVKGLDEKIQGGFFKGSVNMITGQTGTGKSAFCSSFLYDGVKKGEPAIYVTTEQRVEDLRGDIQSMFGWDFTKFEKKKLMKFLYIKPLFPLKAFTGDEINKMIKLYIFDIYDYVVVA